MLIHKKRANQKTHNLLLATTGFIAVWFLNTLVSINPVIKTPAIILVLLLFSAISVLFFRKDRWKSIGLSKWLLWLGMTLSLIFVLQLPYNYSKHDIATYGLGQPGLNGHDGHLGYIAAIVEKIPVILVSPLKSEHTILSHPPLYYLLSAGWMKINLLLGMEETVALENLQLLTWVCSCACLQITDRMMTEADIEEKGRRTGIVLMVFFPMTHILSATLNNDILSDALILACMFYTLRWIKQKRTKDIVGMALSLGFGIATKINAALLIPCIAVVFATSFFKEQKKMHRVGQFIIFIGCSVPEAMAWPLYHALRYSVPLNYVRTPSEITRLNYFMRWERYGLPGKSTFSQIFFTLDPEKEHNVWMTSLKTGLYDESTLSHEASLQWYLAYALLVCFGLLLLIGAALFIRQLIQKKPEITIRLFLGLYGMILFGYYLLFNKQFPYACTANFRYIFTLVPLGCIGYGAAENNSLVCRVWKVLLSVFSILVLIVWGSFFLGIGV